MRVEPISTYCLLIPRMSYICNERSLALDTTFHYMIYFTWCIREGDVILVDMCSSTLILFLSFNFYTKITLSSPTYYLKYLMELETHLWQGQFSDFIVNRFPHNIFHQGLAPQDTLHGTHKTRLTPENILEL